MSENLTQDEIDALADIIWWIQGYEAGAKENYNSVPFYNIHSTALRKARINALEVNKQQE